MFLANILSFSFDTLSMLMQHTRLMTYKYHLKIEIFFNKSKSFIQNSSLAWLFVSEGCVPLALAHIELSLSVGC